MYNCHSYSTIETIYINITFDVYVFTDYITQNECKNRLKIDKI